MRSARGRKSWQRISRLKPRPLGSSSLPHHLRPHTLPRKNFQQDGVFHTAVDDVRFLDAALERIDATFDFGNHARPDDPVLNHLAHLIFFERAEQAAFFVLNALHIGHQNQFFGMQRLGNFARHEIGIDVVSFSISTDADRRNDRDKLVLIQGFDHQRIDPDDLTDHADIDDLRRLAVARFHGNAHLFRQDKAAVLAAETDRHAAVLVDHRDNFFVDLPNQYHLDDIERLFVGDAHAADIPARNAPVSYTHLTLPTSDLV